MGWGSRFTRAIRRPVRNIRKAVVHQVAVVKRVVKQPLKSTKKLVKNPAGQLMSNKIRKNRYYRNFARPVVKVGAAVGAAYVTGGGSLLAMGAGAAVSVASGGLTSKPFNPVRDVVSPAAAGWAVGAVQAAGGISSVSSSVSTTASGLGISSETAGSALALVGKVKGLRKPKASTRDSQAAQNVVPLPVVQNLPNNQTTKGVNWGAIATGAGAGFLVAGPIGAVVGAGAGAVIKKGGV